jgi:hypothetical protein
VVLYLPRLFSLLGKPLGEALGEPGMKTGSIEETEVEMPPGR